MQEAAASKFLKAIFHDPKEYFDYEGNVGIGTKYETKWFAPNDYSGMAQHAVGINDDGYFHLCTHDNAKALASAQERKGKDFNGKYRGQIATATNLHCLWLDLDLAQANKDNGKKYPSYEVAMETLNKLELPPSMITWSGFGLHVYWILTEPTETEGSIDIPRKWLEYLRGEFKGYDLDSVADAARILRVPGTFNKGQPVKIKELNEKTYLISDFEPYIENIPDKQFFAFKGGNTSNVVVESRRRPSKEKMKEIVGATNFSKIFFKTFEFKGDNSHSSTDWVLTKMALELGWDDQSIIDLLVYCRQCNEEQAHEHNPDKYMRTIERARKAQ